MSKEEILKLLKEQIKNFRPSEVIDFAYESLEMMEHIVKRCEKENASETFNG